MAEDSVGLGAAGRFERYIALGDSMSIDRYPSIDVTAAGIDFLPRESDPEVPSLRWPGQLAELPVGAASLLARNADDLWPEFRGRDLYSIDPGIRTMDLALDGGTIPDVDQLQLPSIDRTASPTLVTLTVCGNDLLLAYGSARSRRALDLAAGRIIGEYEALIAAIHDRLPAALAVLTTVYDPSDGTGYIPGLNERGDRLPLAVLDRVNQAIRGVVRARRWTRLADAHSHFLGHGATAPEDGWYWPRSMIEPGARGASELRRLWLEALGA